MGRLKIATGLLLVLLIDPVSLGPLPAKESWGYVDVREGAHMFWWLYYADGSSGSYKDLPLVMWLQGGPGGSGCGFGNFEEIGPLDRDLAPRNTTWIQAASVMFVDNPVGTGYSYTDTEDALTKDVAMVAADMMVLLKNFFATKTEFHSVPFYIFSESYGGKMAAAIALELTKAIEARTIKCNFAGVALGDSWISPLDSVLTWGPYLYSTSLLDDYGLGEVTRAAKAVEQAVNESHFERATELWSITESVVEQNTNGVNFYNILTQDPDGRVKQVAGDGYLAALRRRHVRPLHRQSLGELMNGPIRKKLGVIPENVTWGGQANAVFTSMEGDFMKPVVDIVDQLLAAGVNVTVYNGQLDLIVDTMGQELWVKKLKWPGLPHFTQQQWTALDDPASPGQTGAFYKIHKNFAFYWILKAGHMIPSDQGAMALKMLRMVTQQE
ncbi:retinoid-inducible serine carboxypeptidase [Megalops cyprinoides]|uniref:retinoid-inducible serine carboxypeptidase n=1 Tax=Megalops cyprinoides TaxID=118141 RepID=UPI00186514B7|nr:retinoid-inducible serine carboxypeptidase [Megalops cyprinoides]XP_036409197.1 retinoid-inducible serine carboxypeptidase [Megalops cyprinoides]